MMRALRKGQASVFNITRDIYGEARIVERAFGLGTLPWPNGQFVGERLELEAAHSSSHAEPTGHLLVLPSPADCNRASAR